MSFLCLIGVKELATVTLHFVTAVDADFNSWFFAQNQILLRKVPDQIKY